MGTLKSTESEREQIISLVKKESNNNYPDLINHLSKNAPVLSFADWVKYFQFQGGSISEYEAYEKAELLAVHFFGFRRFKNYDSYRTMSCRKIGEYRKTRELSLH